MKPRRSVFRRIRLLLRGREKGAVAVAFILSLPILLIVIGILIQLALIANARLTLERALAAGARTAQTALPTDIVTDGTDGSAMVRRSIHMTLESISPAGLFTPSPDAQDVANSLEQLGLTLPDRYAERYTYAQNVSNITIQPIDANGQPTGAFNFYQQAAPRVRITVTYDFLLSVPAVNSFIGHTATFNGAARRLNTMTSSIDVQLSPGRQTPTNGGGDPQ